MLAQLYAHGRRVKRSHSRSGSKKAGSKKKSGSKKGSRKSGSKKKASKKSGSKKSGSKKSASKSGSKLVEAGGGQIRDHIRKKDRSWGSLSPSDSVAPSVRARMHYDPVIARDGTVDANACNGAVNQGPCTIGSLTRSHYVAKAGGFGVDENKHSRKEWVASVRGLKTHNWQRDNMPVTSVNWRNAAFVAARRYRGQGYGASFYIALARQVGGGGWTGRVYHVSAAGGKLKTRSTRRVIHGSDDAVYTSSAYNANVAQYEKHGAGPAGRHKLDAVRTAARLRDVRAGIKLPKAERDRLKNTPAEARRKLF